jgi:hypothetical protein
MASNEPSRGRLDLRFEVMDDDSLHLSLSDDGRGLDLGKVAEKAIRSGLLDAGEVSRLTQEELLELVFLDGLSTAETVTEESGRGVGMSALRAAVHEVGGKIRLRSLLTSSTVLENSGPGSESAHALSVRAVTRTPAHKTSMSCAIQSVRRDSRFTPEPTPAPSPAPTSARALPRTCCRACSESPKAARVPSAPSPGSPWPSSARETCSGAC